MPVARYIPPPATPAPVAVTIPALDMDAAPLMGLGILPDNTMQTPPVTEPMRLGWFTLAARPGDVGPAIIAGHVSGRPPGAERSVPGVFAHLADLEPGDRITVLREDGSALDYAVRRVELHEKDAFPTAAVYGDVGSSVLRLITCGGTYDPAAHSYESNVVVFADLS